MTEAPMPQSSSLTAVSFLSKASDDLVTRLTERAEQSVNSEISFQKAVEMFEQRWMESESVLAKLQKDHEATLNALSLSETAYGSLKQASEDRSKVDTEAIKEAHRERNEARAMEWALAGGGVAVGALLIELAHRLGWVK